MLSLALLFVLMCYFLFSIVINRLWKRELDYVCFVLLFHYFDA